MWPKNVFLCLLRYLFYKHNTLHIGLVNTVSCGSNITFILNGKWHWIVWSPFQWSFRHILSFWLFPFTSLGHDEYADPATARAFIRKNMKGKQKNYFQRKKGKMGRETDWDTGKHMDRERNRERMIGWDIGRNKGKRKRKIQFGEKKVERYNRKK